MAKQNGRRCAGRVEHRLSLPNASSFKGSVDAKDVIVGAAAGLAGSAGIRYGLNYFGLASRVPAFLVRFLPAITGLAAGAALFAVQKGSSKAKAHLVGATAAGLAVNIWQEMQTAFPTLNDYVSLRLPGMNGVIVRDGYDGVLINDPRVNLAELQTINLQDDQESSAL